jgi:amino acid adenylation domain-containing protein
MKDLSPAQERLWFLAQLDPEDAAYHLPLTLRLRGPLNRPALERALAEIAARHEPLRQRFAAVDGVPKAFPVTPGGDPAMLRVIECGGEDDAREIVAALAVRPFELAVGPLIRQTLIRLDSGDHILSLVLHHLVADGWSLQVLQRELAALYEAFAAGAPSPLPELPVSYQSHVDRQRSEPVDPADLAYWVQRLAAPPVLELPTDRPRPPVRGGRGDSVIFPVPPELLAGLETVARQQRSSLFQVLLAAYQVLLARHSGQQDLCVGTPVLGRDDPDTEHLIGYFAETLVLRGDLSGDPAFTELVKATRGNVLRDFSHRGVPFERLIAELDVERDRSRTPLFQTMFMYLKQDEPARARFGEPFDYFFGQSKTDLALDLIHGPTGGMAFLTYDSDLFAPASAERIRDRFLLLLNDIVARPGARLSELNLLGEAERAELLSFNDTALATRPRPAPELFAEQARKTPGAVAISFNGTDVTYAELDAEAGRIAALVHGRGPLIGVCLRRTPSMVAALLGIWRAGAAYLPLDPDYPAGRLALVAEDSGIGVVLTEQAFAARFDDRALLIESTPDSPLAPQPLADLAYVLYTSGSTGRPKGVAVPHEALAAFLHAMAGLTGEQGATSWLALTSLSFDISGLELYLPLTRGGRIVLVPDETMRDGPALTGLIASSAVRCVQATPSGWRLLLEAGFTGPGILALVGGEALPASLARELRERAGRLVNVYGPTETTIWSSAWPVPEAVEPVLIGGPISGTQLYVLTEDLDLQPVGVPGELCIAGAGLARGYLGRPGLTASRFVPDPYGPPGSRLYRTGDRARWLAGGAVEFLGRVDNQVKVRGHRIELGEIESVLSRHPEAGAVAVLVRAGTLIAFAEAGRESIVDDLLDLARSALPAYMVPAAIVVLESLPLTPNGKIDRKALPEVQRPVTEFVEPRTPAEHRVAAVFAEVLGQRSVGAHDDFFALGGHSLLAAKVIARIGKIAVRELFDYPTVAGFASRVEGLAGTEPIVPRPAGTPIPLSPAQQRLWFLQRLEPADSSYNMFNVVRLRGSLDVTALTRALGDLVARHETLRTRYPDTDGVPMAVVEPFSPELELLGADDEEHARRLVATRTNTAFDLAAAPPVRVSLIRLGPGDHVLCLIVHHVAGDGWSLNILREDLAAFYLAHLDPLTTPGLPPLPVQYADVSVHEAGLGPDGEALAYWRQQLANPSTLDLPADQRRTPGTHPGGFHGFRIPDELTRKLERLAAQHKTTLFTVLLAAFQVFLSRHSGQRDVLVGSTFAARDRVEIERVVGYFASTLVLRGDLTGSPSFAELVDQARTTVLAAMNHQKVPFEDLLDGDRDPARPARFQTMFILHTQDTGESSGTFAGLSLEFFDSGYQAAKFDLMLEAWRDSQGLSLVFGYNAGLFAAPAVREWAARFGLLCEAVAAKPGDAITALPLLTVADTEKLAGWESGPALGATPDVVSLIRSAPADAVALTCGSDRLTYADLNHRADSAAQSLLAAGVRPGSLVGVRLDRGTDAIVALLAIHRAGCAYLPLDPALPPDRVAWLTANSQLTHTIDSSFFFSRQTNLPLTHALASAPMATATLAEAVPHSVAVSGIEPAGEADAGVVGEGGAAYVLYTSGSTGQPKGVVVGHEALAARVAWMRDAYQLSTADRVVQFAALSFDTHAEEIYPTLASGATLQLLPGGALSLPEHLRTEAGQEVTVLDLPTAYWHQLVEQIDQIAWPARLRLVILGGEQAQAAAVRRWRERFGDQVRLVNTYGPTEATIIATAAELTSGESQPPIGAPIAGVLAIVADEFGGRVPPGVPGELWLGGAGLARGYHLREDLTAERFVTGAQGRFYRTGDRVRWRADGQLEFLGRFDDQVKVRGIRVEPGEVEAMMLAHPGVGQAAVLAHDGALIGYFTGDAVPEELTGYLHRVLPSYLVPDLVARLENLPLTANGKVDRQALAVPVRQAGAEHVAPRTDAEVLIAEVWQEVLGREKVGAFDDFFALGGHSLLAVRVGARIRAAIDLDIPIRLMFTHRSVATLAVAVEELLMAELADLSDAEIARQLAVGHEAETR